MTTRPPLTWQTVFLICFVFVCVLGTCIWLVAARLAPASIISIPFGGLLLLGSGAAGGFLKGLPQMPPVPPGYEWKPVKSLPPPPPLDELAGTTIPITQEEPHEK